MPKFTLEQEDAITRSGSNIIVSAGAGSGKTAVLTERVLRKVKSGIDINKILVLTFTKEAAGEMKDRIRNALKSEGLTDELDYIDSAYITTFDSYALSIVKKYNYLLNVKKNVSIIDSSIISIKKLSVIDEIFNNRYGDEKFDNFVKKYSVKDDNNLKELILMLSEKMNLIIDKEEYLNNYIDNYYSEDNIDSFINEYTDLLYRYIKNIRQSVYCLAGLSSEKFESDLVSSIEELMSSTDYESIYKNINVDLPRLPSGSDDETKKERDRLKKLVDKLKTLVIYENLDEVRSSLLNEIDDVKVIISLIKEIDEKIDEFKYSTDSFEFIDIAKMAIKVLKENEDIRECLKNYYNEIMIDEYQDTNDIQESFINLIENNNVYMVGDIKQSIYRFRNANPNIFREKYNNYSNNDGGVKIDLLKNFRSRSEVLESINNIFERIMDDNIGDADYRDTHEMIFGNNNYLDSGNNGYDNKLDVITYNDYNNYSKDEIEAFIICNDIINKVSSKYQVMDKESGLLKNIDYSDFCIIMDRNATFDTYKQIFTYMHIPLVLYKDEKLTNNTDLYLIKNLLNLVVKIKNKVFDKEFRYMMVSVLRSFLIRMNDEDIFDILTKDEFKNSDVFKKLEFISNIVDTENIYNITNMILNEFNIYENTIYRTDIDESILRIEYILDLANTLNNASYNIYEYIEYLNNMIDYELDIRYKINTKGTNAVKIMNIHKSKGLEFPICYYSGFYKRFNIKDITSMFLFDKEYGIILPDIKDNYNNTFIYELYKEKYNKEEISEKIRLLYVALTRSREKMIIVMPNIDNNDSNRMIVSDEDRLTYNSFLSIMSSIMKTITDRIKEIDLDSIKISKDYKINSNIINEKSNSDIVIEKKYNDIEYKVIEENKYSKYNTILISEDDKYILDTGIMKHYLLECDDFYNPKSNEAKALVSKLGDLNDTVIYKEYEFVYEDNDTNRHGIIDLMIEYPDEIKIIDYKLSNIEDDNYSKQLEGYKKYISTISDKKINTYLYSINNNELKEI